jgi:adenylate cyclase
MWLQSDRLPVLAGLACLLLVALLQFSGLAAIDRLGMLLFDSYQRAAPRPYEPAPVRVVDIDEESLRRLGQWPWPRTDIARLTERLSQAGAAVIAYDIVFSEPDRTSPARIAERLRRDGQQGAALASLAQLPDNDAKLAEAFAHAPVVGGYFLVQSGGGPPPGPKAGMAVAGSALQGAVPRYRKAIQSLPQLRDAAAGAGFVTLPGEDDSIVRKAPLLALAGGQILPSLSLDAVRQAQGAGAIVVKTSDGSGEGGGAAGQPVALKVGQFEVPLTADGAMWVHYTRPQAERTVPAWKVLEGGMSDAQMQETFGGMIVFVGAGAIGLRDLVSTPLGTRDLGVMVHAQAAEQMILGKFLMRPDWAPGLERALLLVLGIGMAMALPRMGAVRGAALGGVLVAGMIGGSWLGFTQRGFLLDPTWPVLGLVLVYLTETALTYYREERRRAYIHDAFDRYLSPELVKRIAADPGRLELGGEERDMTVLFCDIRAFSRVSEKLDPRQIVSFLIAFLTPMCDILLARKATIDKFIGDAIVAFWNAPLDDPEHQANAARAALDMARRLEALNRDPPQGWPGGVRIGIGINSGLCCVGNMGSAQRLSYSLIGDTVNLASRIEGLTKYYGVQIAIGSALAANLQGFALLELDRVRVVGRDSPETVHALLGDESVAAGSDCAALVAIQAQFLTAYRMQDWQAARAKLEQLVPLAPAFGLEPLFAIYADRIAALANHPPQDGWDGIFIAADK